MLEELLVDKYREQKPFNYGQYQAMKNVQGTGSSIPNILLALLQDSQPVNMFDLYC